MIVLLVVAGVLLLLANATFVGAEFATVAARRTRLARMAAAGDSLAAAAIRHSSSLPRTLAALQLAISLASIGLGFTLEAIVDAGLAPLAGAAALTVAAIALTTALHTVFGEMVPKNLAIAEPERLARWLAVPTSIARWLSAPIVPLVWGSTHLVLRILRIETPATIEVARSADEIRTMLETSHAEGTIREYDEVLLSRILAFALLRATEAMVSWAEVTTVPETATVAQLEARFAETRRGRLPIRAANEERIVGYVKSCDLGLVPDSQRDLVLPASLVRGVVNLDESATVVGALESMRSAGRHFAVVTAPDGTSRGIVTMRSVIELLLPGTAPSA